MENLVKSSLLDRILFDWELIATLQRLHQCVHRTDSGLLVGFLCLEVGVVAFKNDQLTRGPCILGDLLHEIGYEVLDEYYLLENVHIDALLTLELLVLSSEEAFIAEFFLELEDASFTTPFEDVPPLGKGGLHHFQTLNVGLSLDLRLEHSLIDGLEVHVEEDFESFTVLLFYVLQGAIALEAAFYHDSKLV